jgi:hypothetical protein
MKQFDYQMAHRELAAPAFRALAPHVASVVAWTANIAAPISQDGNLSMPWPADPQLRENFETLTDKELAESAQVVYFYGHWGSPGGKDNYLIHRSGTYWKYSRYATQLLLVRTPASDLARFSEGERGYSVKVIDGVIRICWSSRHSWMWEQVALATPRNTHAALGLLDAVTVGTGFGEDDFAAVAAGIRAHSYDDTSDWVNRLMTAADDYTE